MTLTLNLPPALEESLKQHAAASGMDVEAFVIEAVRSKVGPTANTTYKPKVTVEEFRKLLEEMIALHPPVSGHVDDSRESIYD
jgi:hypothetical protein